MIHNHGSAWGGNEKWLATLAAGLLRRGHRVTVACRPSGPVADELARRGIPVVGVRPGGYLDAVRGLGFAAWLRRERPDAVLLTSRKGAAWGAWAARAAGARVVARAGIAGTPQTWRHQLPFRRWMDGVIVNARFIADEWRRNAPWFPAERVHVVLNGTLPPRRGTSSLTRADVCGDAGAVLVAGAGNLAHRKGFDLLLRAAARLDAPEVRPVIVGAGEAEGELRALAADLGIAERVVWMGHRGDVPDVLAACDLFVLSSRSEGMANVMLEAMSVGTPVVATDISGVAEALAGRGANPPAGWIVAPDDADALADAIRAVLDLRLTAPREIERRVTEARRRIDEWFTVDRMVDECERILFASDFAHEAPFAGSGAKLARR
ncbi:MAG: glycosyl transferase [Gemmatimonadetes bacterium]|nr:glycosyl transferase [Gemmatimonadota bacterium]